MFRFEMLSEYACDWWTRLGLNYPAVWGFALFAAFAYGACLGSFINVCIWRMPRRESVVSAPSHCTKCGAHIRWYDNLPVASFLVLRGRCRVCRAPYSPRYFIVEVLTGALFAAILVKTGLTQQHPGAIYFYCVLTLLAVGAAWIDAEWRIIPDALNYPAMALALAGALLLPEAWGGAHWWQGGARSLLSGALPGAGLWLFSVIGEKLCGREVLGRGDVKFVAAIGMLAGLSGALFAVTFGALTGALCGFARCALRHEPAARCAIPFGPFLAAGAVVWIFAGSWLLKLCEVLSYHAG
ncbi:MAG: prepilin peptidase [Lentisphaeria bacterium]|nr:prepilin peptidase [Lentisphaeria bacterium]